MAISLHTAGSWVAANATTQTVTLPTHSAGDMLLVRVAFKHATMPTTVTCGTSGWAKIGQYNNGTTVSGNGTGSVIVAVFWKEATSSSETSPVITYHASVAATPSAAVAMAYQKAAGEVWATPVGDGGPCGTSTALSTTIQSHISTTAGDMVDFFHSQGDNNTLTVPTFTQAGLTLDTVSEQPATALSSGTSNDIDADGGYRLVNSGTSSAAAVITGTSTAGDQGSGWTTRLRVSANVLIQPGAASVTIAGATPTVVAQNYISVTPAAAAVSIAGATPTVAIVLVPVLVQPGAASVTIATATPAIVAQNWPRIQPAAAAVTIATATPTVVAQNYIRVQPAAAAVAIGTATPAITLPVSVQPAAASVTLAGATPAVAVHVLVLPAAASVAFSGATPAIATPVRVLPAAAAVSIAGATPALVAQNWPLVQPAAAAITITGATPAVAAVAVTLVQPAAAAVTVAGATPAVSATQTYIPDAAAITIEGATPAITAQDYRLIQPGPASVAITSFAPDLVITDHKLVQPSPAAIAIAGAVPAIYAGDSVSYLPGPASLVITGVAPRVRTTDWSKMTKVMEGIATILREKGYQHVWAYPVPTLTVPATIVGYPTTIEYDLVYQRGADRFVIVVRLVVGTGSNQSAWNAIGAALLGPDSLAEDLDGQYPWGIARVQRARVEGLVEGSVTYATARAEVEVIA